MKRLALLVRFLFLAIAATVFTGCASDQPEDPDRVSTIPWNRPEKWEGQGPMGGFSPGTQ